MVAAFAEVASRFTRAGGTYLYARVAFGRFAGIEMAWLTYLVRLTAAATNANLFIIYLAEFWPRATGPVESRVLLALVLLPLAAANYRGVRGGVRTSTAFAVAKLVPLAAVRRRRTVRDRDGRREAVPASGRARGRGYVAGGDPSPRLRLRRLRVGAPAAGRSEGPPARRADRAVHGAGPLRAALHPGAGGGARAPWPIPAPAIGPSPPRRRSFLGPLGAGLMAAGALVSVYGYLAAAMVNVPRLTYAMAAEGDLPPRLGAVHPVSGRRTSR